MKWTLSDSIINRWTVITVVLGLSITAFATLKIESNNQIIINNAVKSTSEHAIQEVQDRIRLYQYGLRGARGAILTAGEEGISRRLFLRYSLSRNTSKEFPGARGFGFIRRVKPSDVADFVHSAQQDGWLNFRIKELGPNSDERYVIQYIEPVARNFQAIGLDIASEKNRRTAARQAIETGTVQLTGPITLVQAKGSPLQSVLILMPIYSSGFVPETREMRDERAYGWTYAPLLMNEVMANISIDNKHIHDDKRLHLQLYDITDPHKQELFFDNNPTAADSFYSHVSKFPIYGRIWEGRISVPPIFIDELNLLDPKDVFGIGVLISFLSATLLGISRVRRKHRQEIISQQAKMAAIVESSSDGIIGTTMTGIVTSWNKGAEKIFGYQRDEVIGGSIYHLLVPIEFHESEKRIFEQLRLGVQISHYDTVRKTKDGEGIAVSLAISPIYGANGKVIGASKSVRDNTAQKAAEARILELNNNLENQVKERTEELQKLNLILNDVLNASSEIAIIATDIHGQITLFNSGAQRMLKYSDEEVIGKLTPLTFHKQEEIAVLRKELSLVSGTAINSGLSTLFYKALHKEADNREWTYVDKQGEFFEVSVVITPMHDNKGSVIGFLNMAIDITEQKKSNSEIISMRDQLLMAANVAQLGIWTWNVQTNELDWNDMMFQIYQQPMRLRQEGLMYQHWVERVHPDDKEVFEQALQTAVSNREEFDHLFRIVSPDQSIRYIQARAYVELGRHGRVINVTGINRDITSEHELEAWLRRAKEEADAANLAKSEFLANMSHEIRTPMNAVLGMLQLVKRTALNVQQDDYISKAHIAATSLLGLINDILDYSKVDAGKLDIEHHPFSLNQLVSELNTLVSGHNMTHSVGLYYDIDLTIPPYLIGDYLRVLQVLTNLSSNALKFTMQGQVNISIVQTASEAGISYLLFEVKDTGIGIDASKIEHIFEVFSQAESSTARRFGGSGLGLVICRRLVSLMGGELKVDSELGKGSRFYFSLAFPIADPDGINLDKARQVADLARQSKRKLTGLKILIVEDNAFNRQVAEELLIAEGASITLAEGGEEAIAVLSEADDGAFDAVLMDMQMPNVDGLEATRRIRRDHRFTQLPIIAMTANVSLADQQACLQAGMNDHIGKPLDVDLMISVICQHVGRSNESFFSSTLVTDDTVDASLLNVNQEERVESSESIMARFAGNQELYKSLTQSFLQESEGLISSIEQGLNEQSKTSVQENLHTFKGSTGTMGLTTLSNEIAAIESRLKHTDEPEEINAVLAEVDVAVYRKQVKIDLDTVLRGLDTST